MDLGAEKYVNWDPELCGKLQVRAHIREIMGGLVLGSGDKSEISLHRQLTKTILSSIV